MSDTITQADVQAALTDKAAFRANIGTVSKAGDELTGSLSFQTGTGYRGRRTTGSPVQIGHKDNGEITIEGRNFDNALVGIGIGSENTNQILPIAGGAPIDKIVNLGRPGAAFGDIYNKNVNSEQVYAGPKDGWTSWPWINTVPFAQMQGISRLGNIGVLGASRSSDQVGNPSSEGVIGLAGFALADTFGPTADTVYAAYLDPVRSPPSSGGEAGTMHGFECNPTNFGNTIDVTPYAYNQKGSTEGGRIMSGRDNLTGFSGIPQKPMSVGLIIKFGESSFRRGIVFDEFAIDPTGDMEAIATAVGQKIAGHRPSGSPTEIVHLAEGDLKLLGRNTSNSPVGLVLAPAGGNGVVPNITNELALGTPSFRWQSVTSVKYMYDGNTGDFAGLGSPEGVISAGPGSTFRRIDGLAGTCFYVKESGAGTSGWVAK